MDPHPSPARSGRLGWRVCQGLQRSPWLGDALAAKAESAAAWWRAPNLEEISQPPHPRNLLLPRPPRHLRTPTTSPRLFGTQVDFIWPSSLLARSLSVSLPAFPGWGLSFSSCSLQTPAICEGESQIGSRERATLEVSPWLVRIDWFRRFSAQISGGLQSAKPEAEGGSMQVKVTAPLVVLFYADLLPNQSSKLTDSKVFFLWTF